MNTHHSSITWESLGKRFSALWSGSRGHPSVSRDLSADSTPSSRNYMQWVRYSLYAVAYILFIEILVVALLYMLL